MTSPFPPTIQPVSLGIFSNLNLSSSQQSRIQSIVGSAQSGQVPFSQVVSQVESLLTPTQQSTFKGDLQELEAGAGHRHHHGGGGGSNAASSSLLSSSSADAFGVSDSSTAAASTTTADAFGIPVTTPGSTLADAFGVQSVSNPIGSSAASTPNASNVYSPFQTLAAQYQVQQQLQAGSLANLF